MGLLDRLFGEEKTPVDNAESVAIAGADFAARLAHLEFIAHKLVSGMTAGAFLTPALGSGWDTAEAREYQAGDDVRRIDWPATARTGVTQVRPTYADRELLTVVVVDGSASMMFGTLGVTKFELSVAIAAAVTEVAVRRGNPVAAARATTAGVEWFPPVGSRTDQRLTLRRLTAPFVSKGQSQLSEALWQIHRMHPRTRSVVVLTDGLVDGLEPPLRALSTTRKVSVIEPFDRREREMTAVGDAAFAVGEAQYWLDTDNPAVRERFRRLAEERANERAQLVHRAGATHLATPCDEDWRDEVATALLKTVVQER